VEAYACVAAADRAVAAAARHATGHNEQLVVGVFVECFPFLVEPLARFAQIRPDVHVEVRELDMVTQGSALDERRVDIALLCGPPPDAPGFALSEEPLVIGLARQHPRARRTVLTVDAVADELFPRLPPGTPAHWSDRLLLKAERGGTLPRLTERPYFTPLQVMPDIAVGKVITPSPAFVADRLARGPIVAVPLADVAPIVIGFAWGRASAAVRAFVETLGAMAEDPASLRPAG
jgi:hypothetical protein